MKKKLSKNIVLFLGLFFLLDIVIILTDSERSLFYVWSAEGAGGNLFRVIEFIIIFLAGRGLVMDYKQNKQHR